MLPYGSKWGMKYKRGEIDKHDERKWRRMRWTMVVSEEKDETDDRGRRTEGQDQQWWWKKD